MKVEAVRDDGALLVTKGNAAAVVLDGRIVGFSSRDSALSKGVPWVAATDQRVPAVPGLEEDLVRLGKELREVQNGSQG